MRACSLTNLLLLSALCAACSGSDDPSPDMGVDQSLPADSQPLDTATDITSADQGETCTPDEARCVAGGNAVERCGAGGVGFTVDSDCDALKLPVATFTCEACPAAGGATAGATCKASRQLFSGKVSGDLPVSVDYVYERQCGPLVVQASFVAASGTTSFEHLVAPAGTKDGAYPQLTLSAPDLSKAPSGQFLLFSAGAGQAVPLTVVLSTAVGVDCKNTSPAGAGTPPGAGTATLTYAKTDPGETMSIVIDGYLTCDEGVTWKTFKYTASGIAF
jgi:hypothetical protein